MRQQIKYFGQDLTRMLGKYKIRILHIWLSRVFWGIFLYRLERGLFLLIGKPYEIIRVIFIPIFNIIQAYSNIDLNYKSDIKGGLLVLHPSNRSCNFWSFSHRRKHDLDWRKYNWSPTWL